MSYYSEALQEMDKNTMQYMIEEQQEQIEEQKNSIRELEEEREANLAEIAELKRQLAAKE